MAESEGGARALLRWIRDGPNVYGHGCPNRWPLCRAEGRVCGQRAGLVAAVAEPCSAQVGEGQPAEGHGRLAAASLQR